MGAIISNGLGSKYVVRDNTGQIKAGVVILSPFEDKQALTLLKAFYETSSPKLLELGELLRDCDKHWKDIESYDTSNG